MKRLTVLLLAGALLVAACGRLGVGTPACEPTIRDPEVAILLEAQAVQTADYAPCISELKVGWDDVQFEAESGEAGFAIRRADEIAPFLEVSLTPSCDVSGAAGVPSGYPDIRKYVAIHQVEPRIDVTIIPVEPESLHYAEVLLTSQRNRDLDGRPVEMRADLDFAERINNRIDRAFANAEFVWLVTGLDVADGTLELRDSPDRRGWHGLSLEEAWEQMSEESEEVEYRGEWYYTFEGGCITYRFDAEGTMAETIAADVQEALGFYPLYELRAIAEEIGYDMRAPQRD